MWISGYLDLKTYIIPLLEKNSARLSCLGAYVLCQWRELKQTGKQLSLDSEIIILTIIDCILRRSKCLQAGMPVMLYLALLLHQSLDSLLQKWYPITIINSQLQNIAGNICGLICCVNGTPEARYYWKAMPLWLRDEVDFSAQNIFIRLSTWAWEMLCCETNMNSKNALW